jgi:hypothetical protein
MKIVLMSLVVLLACRTATAPDFKEGAWELTTTVQIPGMPTEMKPIVGVQCLTKKDVVPLPPQGPGQGCKRTNEKVTVDSVEWTVECEDEEHGRAAGGGRATYNGDAMTANIYMSMSHRGETREVNYKMTAKRLGPCMPTP